MTLHLLRTERGPDGVFGVLVVNDRLVLYTVEDDWRDNQPNASCIPAGTYRLRRTVFHKHGYATFEVLGVPGRSRILIHIANTEENVEGCIGLGLELGKLTVSRDEDSGRAYVSKRAALTSGIAFKRFMDAMTGIDEATLVIQWADDVAPDMKAAA